MAAASETSGYSSETTCTSSSSESFESIVMPHREAVRDAKRKQHAASLKKRIADLQQRSGSAVGDRGAELTVSRKRPRSEAEGRLRADTPNPISEVETRTGDHLLPTIVYAPRETPIQRPCEETQNVISTTVAPTGNDYTNCCQKPQAIGASREAPPSGRERPPWRRPMMGDG